MTIFEKIKAMSVEEMATEISHLDCCACPLNDKCFEKASYMHMSCKEKIQTWLESEVEKDA